MTSAATGACATAQSFDVSVTDPDIQVVDVDLLGDRRLKLQYVQRNGVPLEPETRKATLTHLRWLWGYEVSLEEVPPAHEE